MKSAELRDNQLEQKLCNDGFVLIRDFLNHKEVAELSALYKSLHPESNEDKGMWNSLFDVSGDTGMMVSEKILAILAPHFDRIFVSYKAPVATFMSKNCNDKSVCDLHRDFSTFDEEKFQYRNIWIPLVSTANNNGALYVLRSSNKVFDYVLPMFTDWPYKPMQAKLFTLTETVITNPGDLIIYLDKTLHGSHVNHSTDSRPVVHLGVLHPEMEMYFYYHDRDTGKVRVYAVPFSFFFEKDYSDQAGKYPLIKEFEYAPPKLDFETVKARLQKLSAV